MSTTLRDWLDTLERHDLLARIGHEVHVNQLAAVIEQNHRRATLFENVRGYALPLAANTFSNRAMMALALGCDEGGILAALTAKRQARIDPVVITEAPCQEIVEEGETVNLATLPLHLQHELDGAPFISAAVMVAKDPVRGVNNLGIYRMMYRSQNETGIDLTAPHKLRHYYQQACELGRPLEVAAVLGLPAIDLMAALASTPLDEDEYAVLGGFRGEAAELVACRSIDLLVPANAEMVLEGEMLPTGWIADEGPYGEFTGTYGGGLKQNPTIRIKAITRRRDAVFLSATHGGHHPGWTDMHVLFPMIELDIHNALVQAGIDVRAVRALPASSGMWAVASIKSMFKGDGKNALALMLAASKQAFPKIAVVVDEDIDIFDDEQVTWAMTWRAQPDQDVMILGGMKAVPLDPSLPSSTPTVTTAKMGFDATIPVGRDRADFAICRPAVLGETGRRPELVPDELDTALADFIGQGAVHFQEILEEFSGPSATSVLESFGRLRQRHLLGRDEVGRYVLLEAIDDNPGVR